MNSLPPGRRSAATTPAQLPHARQPAQRADARVDEVERRGCEDVEGAQHVRADEADVRTGRGGELCRGVERRLREVQSGDAARAESGERQRVGADVALQVDDVESGDVAEAGQVEAHDIRQE
jgi:hypothetical protein